MWLLFVPRCRLISLCWRCNNCIYAVRRADPSDRRCCYPTWGCRVPTRRLRCLLAVGDGLLDEVYDYGDFFALYCCLYCRCWPTLGRIDERVPSFAGTDLNVVMIFHSRCLFTSLLSPAADRRFLWCALSNFYYRFTISAGYYATTKDHLLGSCAKPLYSIFAFQFNSVWLLFTSVKHSLVCCTFTVNSHEQKITSQTTSQW